MESATVLREVGAAFSLAPNAMRILHGWGIRPELVGASEVEGMQIWNGNGDVVADIKFDNELYGIECVRSVLKMPELRGLTCRRRFVSDGNSPRRYAYCPAPGRHGRWAWKSMRIAFRQESDGCGTHWLFV